MARGDHIKVYRRGRLYSHHGIDMGDGSVIHFNGAPLQWGRARVVRSTMTAFLAGGRCRVVAHRGPVRPVDEVLATAVSLLDTSRYSVFRNNCEHFATFCKTGSLRSRQARRALLASSVVAVAISARPFLRVFLAGRNSARGGLR